MSEDVLTTELTTSSGQVLNLLDLGLVDYLKTQDDMRTLVESREEGSRDQIWVLQHPPVYTQGTACQQTPLLPSEVPIVKSDRGGQITYHGPGQIVMYPMLRLKKYGMGVKALVASLEQSVIELLADYEIVGERREDAPGVYVDGAKIAALGLRIKRGTSYHGLSLNVDMNLRPFTNIDPCGYQGLRVTQLSDHVEAISMDEVKVKLLAKFGKLI